MYNKNIKYDILTTTSFTKKKCCFESFLVGFLKGSRFRSYAKLSGKLSKAAITVFNDYNSNSIQSERINVTVRKSKDRLHFRGLDMLNLRQNFINRFLMNKKKYCARSFLQGLFLSCGYVQNPEQSYHLEFKIKEKWIKSAFKYCISRLKLDFKYCSVKNTSRFYIKSVESIIKFLSVIGLFDRASELSDLVQARKVLSEVNRKVNFETSNINKAITAAEQIISNINELFELENQEFWTENLYITAKTRIKYPHDSIEQLGKRFNPALSKSAVNYRLRKINSIYKKLIKNKINLKSK